MEEKLIVERIRAYEEYLFKKKKEEEEKRKRSLLADLHAKSQGLGCGGGCLR